LISQAGAASARGVLASDGPDVGALPAIFQP